VSECGRSRRWAVLLLPSHLAGCDPPFQQQRPGAGLRLGGVRREWAVPGGRAPLLQGSGERRGTCWEGGEPLSP